MRKTIRNPQVKIALYVLVVLSLGAVFFAQCSSDGDLADNFITNEIAAGDLTPDANGVVTVTYAQVDSNGVSTGSFSSPAFQAGFAMWNQQTSATGIKFVPAAKGEEPDVSLTPGPPGSCIEGSSAGADIRFDTNWVNRQNSTNPTIVSQTTVSVAHEIGHLLGLDDRSPTATPAGIMNQATGTCSTGTSTATGVTSADATAASNCQKKAKGICKKCKKA